MVRFLSILTLVIAVVVFSTMAYAGNTGCGVGTQIFQGKDGLVSQLCATTTNGIFANQAFGITSGTLGCSKAPSIVSKEKVQIFVSQNMDNLANDISEGNGEYLNTLATLLEVKEENKSEFYKKMQANFSKIFTSNNITSAEVIENIDQIIKQS